MAARRHWQGNPGLVDSNLRTACTRALAMSGRRAALLPLMEAAQVRTTL